MFTVVGSCPKCGCPIYAPTIHHSILPPPSTPTCDCAPRAQTFVSTDTQPHRGSTARRMPEPQVDVFLEN